MISIDMLRRVSVVYTHAHCPDGMASAMILRDAFRMLGTSPRIDFIAHGTPEHKRAGFLGSASYNAMTLFCDIAPHSASVKYLLDEGGTIVLDHHKGVEELVRSFGDLGVFADEKLEPGVSGAVLAFREVWKPIALEIERTSDERTPLPGVRDFALCVGARDTWQTQSPLFMRGQWISKMLMARPAEYWLREGSNPYLTEGQVDIGMELFAQHEEAVRQAVRQVVYTAIKDGGRRAISLFVFQEQASGFRLTSDVAEAIRSAETEQGGDHEHGVVAGFAYVVDKPGAAPRLLYSLRGLGGFDVASFAKVNGGGGHTAAAGFSMACRKLGDGVVQTDPYQEIAERLRTHLIAPGAGTTS